MAAIPKFAGHTGKMIREVLAEFPDWLVTKTAKGHVRLLGPRGQVVISGGSPGDKWAVTYIRAQIKRAIRQP